MNWKLADAKTKLSEVVRRALLEGPQRIQRRNDAVIVLAEEEYLRLTGDRMDFKAFLLTAPDMDALSSLRSDDPMRDVAL